MTLTGSSTTCSHPEYQFFVQAPGGSWTGQGWQPWNGTATGTFNWVTTGLAPGNYGIGVWARNSGSTATYETYAIASHILSGTCSTAALADNTSGISGPGDAVTWTASAAGCPSPQFEFWALIPGHSSWLMIQGYSSTATYSWGAGATAGSAQGTYQFGVWVRQAGSTNAYDAYTVTTHVLTASCGTAALSAAPASPQSTGTITLTATAAGCAGALFEFWELAPGGSWTVIQAFSTTATKAFTATGAATGHYQFGVWVKSPKSANTYDSFAIITFYVGT